MHTAGVRLSKSKMGRGVLVGKPQLCTGCVDINLHDNWHSTRIHVVLKFKVAGMHPTGEATCILPRQLRHGQVSNLCFRRSPDNITTCALIVTDLASLTVKAFVKKTP